jgi:hypothetical protein
MTRTELRKLIEGATPGPWEADDQLFDVVAGNTIVIQSDRTGVRSEDRALIAAARNALPALLDALDAAVEAIEYAHRTSRNETVDEVLQEALHRIRKVAP